MNLPPLPGLSPVAGKAIVARVDGGQISSDAGMLALRKVERRLALAERLVACIDDPRLPEQIRRGVAEILRDRAAKRCVAAPTPVRVKVVVALSS